MNWEQQETIRLLKGAPGTQYQEADDENKKIFRDWIRGLLQTQSITVTFVKADGTDREMTCTLNWDLLPEKEKNKPVAPVTESAKKPRKEPDVHTLRVFDLEKQEWRSFRFERLKKISAEISFE